MSAADHVSEADQILMTEFFQRWSNPSDPRPLAERYKECVEDHGKLEKCDNPIQAILMGFHLIDLSLQFPQPKDDALTGFKSTEHSHSL